MQSQLNNSACTLPYARTMRSAALLLICIASSAPPRLKKHIRSSACTCLLSPRGLSSMPRRARDAAQYRGTPGGHTLSVRSYSANRCARGFRSRRAATSPNERPSTRSALARNASTVSTVPRAGANGHGYMTKPKSRQAEAFEANGWPNEVAECAAASLPHANVNRCDFSQVRPARRGRRRYVCRVRWLLGSPQLRPEPLVRPWNCSRG